MMYILLIVLFAICLILTFDVNIKPKNSRGTFGSFNRIKSIKNGCEPPDPPKACK